MSDTRGPALTLADSIGHRGWTSLAWRNLGMSRDAAGALAGAEEACTVAALDAKTVPLFVGVAELGFASVRWQTGARDEARELLTRALASQPIVAVEARALTARLGITI